MSQDLMNGIIERESVRVGVRVGVRESVREGLREGVLYWKGNVIESGYERGRGIGKVMGTYVG